MNFSWLLKRCVCFVLTIFNSFFLPVALCKSPLAGYSNEFSYKFVSNHQKSQWSEKREKDNLKWHKRRVTISTEINLFNIWNPNTYQKNKSDSKFLSVIQIRSETEDYTFFRFWFTLWVDRDSNPMRPSLLNQWLLPLKTVMFNWYAWFFRQQL